MEANGGSTTEFESWLGAQLSSWGADASVLVGYVTALLTHEETPLEQKDALTPLLEDILEKDVNERVCEIMEKWQSCHPAVENGATSSSVDVEDRLVKLLGSQSLATLAPKQYTDDEKKIREAILSQYSQCSDNEEGPSVNDLEGDGNLGRNTNAETVAAAARERREQAKQESQRKKDKDKEDREKQKQLKEEKKEKRKTQKGERKR
ncbi:coiled-coil domain-containing protein 43-like [Arctopsyche grandis]|uniref:coiled-coil domain-containing protein 43-like n=1 Tax=Arctopsyche grandis TaxID=121162 RepID=UPI00406D9BA8